MKLFAVLLLICTTGAFAQTAPAPVNLPPDAVVASAANGRKLTFGELKQFMGALPPKMQQMAMQDRRSFVQQYLLMRQLSEMGEQAKLYDKSPTKEQLEVNRMYVLMNAQLNEAMNNIVVPASETQRFYDSNKERYSQVKVKVIYVSFSHNANAPADAKGKKPLSEEQAKARIEKIAGELRGGADFVKLVKEYSEDATSAGKDGDFGTLRRTDNIPEAIRNVVFSLKQGQVSDPVRQPNGFYLFRADEISARPYSEVKDEIYNELKQVHFKQWLDETTRNLNVKYENETFFNTAPAAAPQTPAGR